PCPNKMSITNLREAEYGRSHCAFREAPRRRVASSQDANCLSTGAGAAFNSAGYEAVTQIALRMDGIVTEAMPQTLAQLADVAFDDILINVLVEEPIHRVEDLGFGHAPAGVRDEIFEDATLPPRQGQHLTPDLRVAPVIEHANL